MNKNWIIVGLLTTVLMFAALGTVISAQDANSDAIGENENFDGEFDNFDEEFEDEDVYFLFTKEDGKEVRDAARQMTKDRILENLQNANLTDEEILEIEELLEAIEILREEADESRLELIEQGLSREEIKAEMEPIMEELKGLHIELRETLQEHGIKLFEGPRPGMRRGGPRMGGSQCCEDEGPGFDGPIKNGRGKGMGFPGPKP